MEEQQALKSKNWFALRVDYGCEARLKNYLDNLEIASFVPLKSIDIERVDRTERIFVPAVKNVIFVDSTRATIDRLMADFAPVVAMRYFVDSVSGCPVVVPRKQMEDFMRISGSGAEVDFLELAPHLCRAGERVVVVDGPFKGIEGEVFRIKKNRRLVVRLDKLAAVSLAYIPSRFIERADA